ncbi:MAG TPA: hypothetical protein VF173_30055 [Thermoanaerobaculia bacterium]|nr:hypothetical protein [Thermoanaerobaculia bacterium]
MEEADRQRAAAAVRERMLDSFAPTYLTLISILQGSLLGYLFYVADQFFGAWKDQPLAILGLARILFIGSALIVNIATWNEYRMGSTTFVWIPRLPDTLVPFGLSLVQFSLIRTILLHPKYWFLSMAVFWAVAAFGFWHMYYRAGREIEINGAALKALATYRRSNPLLCGACSTANLLFSALLWNLHLDKHQPSALLLMLAAVSVVFLLSVFIRGELSWSRVIQFSRGEVRVGTSRASRVKPDTCETDA